MKNKLSLLFYLIFCICFTFVCTNAVFQNMYYNQFRIILAMIFCSVLIFIVCKLIWKYCKVSEKDYKKILIIFSIFALVIEIVIGLTWQYDPQFDIGAVQNGATEWARTGTFQSYYEYFLGCPNNIAPMTFLSIFARIASLFGFTNFYAVYVVINSILVTLSMVLVSLICKHLGEIKHAILSLVIFVFSTQLWFMGGAVYTDTLSMLFPILIYWLYLISENKSGKMKIFIYILIGLATAIGSMIKMPVVIMAIAIAIALLLKKGFKEFIKLTTCIVITFITVHSLFNLYIYSYHLDKKHQETASRPITHWIMMGLNENGGYNSSDFSFTDSFDNPIEKRQAINEEIINRIKNRGPSGMYDLILKKSILDFGDGTYGLADFLGQPSERKTKLNDWVLYDGKNYELYGTYVTGMHMVIMILMLIGAYKQIVNKTRTKDNMFPLYISLLGLWLFLMCWETNRRYFSNFVPIIFVCAVLNIDNFLNILHKLKQQFKE